jgi:hypothetical protein
MEPRRRTKYTIALSVVLLGLAVVSGLLVGWYAGDHSSRDWLISFAGSTELFGLLLIASPELVPIIQAAGSAISSLLRRLRRWALPVEDRLRRLVGRPRLHRVGSSVTLPYEVVGRAAPRASAPQAASAAAKVAFLLERDQETQTRFEQVEQKLANLPRDWQSDIADASASLRSEHVKALEQMRDRHMQARLLGVVLVAVGIVLATAGNLV